MNSNSMMALLRRLESQHVWRAASCNAAAMPAQQTFSSTSGGLFSDGHDMDGVMNGHLDGQANVALYNNNSNNGLLWQYAAQQQPQALPPYMMQQGMMNGNMHSMVQARSHAASAADADKNGTEWYDDASMTVPDVLKLLVERIQASGPIKQRHLQHLYQKCETAEDLEKALGLTRLNYLARGELQQHDPFSHRTSSILLQQAMKLGAPELAKRALVRSTEFGFSPANTRLFNHLLIYYSKQKDLRSMVEMYELMKRAGPRPDSETCFILVKGSVDCGRSDIAQAIVHEFDAMGARVRDGVRLYIQQHGSPEQIQQQI